MVATVWSYFLWDEETKLKKIGLIFVLFFTYINNVKFKLAFLSIDSENNIVLKSSFSAKNSENKLFSYFNHQEWVPVKNNDRLSAYILTYFP